MASRTKALVIRLYNVQHNVPSLFGMREGGGAEASGAAVAAEAEGDVVKEGWLIKSPQQWKMKLPKFQASWSKRWFVLRSGAGGGRLEYYTDETRKKRHGVFELANVVQIDSYLTYEARRNQLYQWIFDLQMTNKQIYLVATDERDMNDWVAKLCGTCHLEKDEEGDSDAAASPALSPDLRSPSKHLHAALNNYGTEPRDFCFDFSKVRVGELETPGSPDEEVSAFLAHASNYYQRPDAAKRTEGGADVNLNSPVPAPPGQPPPKGKGYIKLTDCVSSTTLPPPVSPAPGLPVHHGRGRSHDGTTSFQTTWERESAKGRHGSFSASPAPPRPPKPSANGQSPAHGDSHKLSLDSVIPPPPRPPKQLLPPGKYGNAAENRKEALPFNYDAPPPGRPKDIFAPGPANSSGRFNSLPRMPRAPPEPLVSDSQKREMLAASGAASSAVPTNPRQGYTPMTSKIVFYESMSPFANIPDDDDEDSATSHSEDISESKESTSSPSPAPAQLSADSAETYSNLRHTRQSLPRLELQPPAPSPPPIPDRSLKPAAKRESTGPAPPIPAKTQAKPVISVVRKDSFVRPAAAPSTLPVSPNPNAIQVPKRLPRTPVKKSAPSTPRTPKPERERAETSEPLPVPVQPRLQYVEVDTVGSVPGSARTPPPSAFSVRSGATLELPTDEELQRQQYTEIDQTKTHAVKLSLREQSQWHQVPASLPSRSGAGRRWSYPAKRSSRGSSTRRSTRPRPTPSSSASGSRASGTRSLFSSFSVRSGATLELPSEEELQRQQYTEIDQTKTHAVKLSLREQSQWHQVPSSLPSRSGAGRRWSYPA